MKYNSSLLTIDEVCSITDCQHKTAPTLDYPTEYRMLRTVNIRNGQLIDIDSTKSVSKEIYDQWSVRGHLEPGDVILTREAPMGEVALLRGNENYNFFLGQRILQLKAFPDVILPEFLYYSLQTKELRHQIMMNEGTGSVVSNIRIPLLKKIKILVPPLSQQKNKTKILIDIDDKILLNKKIISKLENISQTLFKQWFINFEFPNEEGQPYKSNGGEMKESELGEIPKMWNINNLSYIAEIVMGQSPKSDTYNNKKIGLPLLNGATDFRNCSLSPSKFTSDAKKIGSRGDFVFGVRATIGLVTELDDTYAIGRGSGIAKSLHPEQKEYLYGVLNKAFNEFQYTASGSVYLNVSKNDLMNFKICQPPFDIIKKYHQVVNSMMIQKENLKKQNQNLIQLRNILLPKLLSGEIEVPIQLEV